MRTTSRFSRNPSICAACRHASIGLVILLVVNAVGAQERRTWRVPSRKASVENPVTVSESVLTSGQDIYARECATCHGSTGHGDGDGAAEVDGGVPAFHSVEFSSQTDGALFFKISTGRKPMPGYRQLLSDEEVWGVIHYLRKITLPPVVEPTNRSNEQQLDGISEMLGSYRTMSRSLSAENLEDVRRETLVMLEHLGALASLPVSEDHRHGWGEGLETITSATSALAAAESLEDGRKHFAQLSTEVCALVEGFGHRGPAPLRVLQAGKDGEVLTWLQTKDDDANPFGDSRESRTVRLLAPTSSFGGVDKEHQS